MRVKDKAVNQFSFAVKMQLLYFLLGFFAITVTAFPVKNIEDGVMSKRQGSPSNGLLGTGIGVPKGLLGTGIASEDLLGTQGPGNKNGLLGTGIGVPKGLLGTGLAGESLIGGTPGGVI